MQNSFFVDRVPARAAEVLRQPDVYIEGDSSKLELPAPGLTAHQRRRRRARRVGSRGRRRESGNAPAQGFVDGVGNEAAHGIGVCGRRSPMGTHRACGRVRPRAASVPRTLASSWGYATLCLFFHSPVFSSRTCHCPYIEHAHSQQRVFLQAASPVCARFSGPQGLAPRRLDRRTCCATQEAAPCFRAAIVRRRCRSVLAAAKKRPGGSLGGARTAAADCHRWPPPRRVFGR